MVLVQLFKFIARLKSSDRIFATTLRFRGDGSLLKLFSYTIAIASIVT